MKPNEAIQRSQFKYNCRNKNLYLILLGEFRDKPLKLSRTNFAQLVQDLKVPYNSQKAR